MAKLSFHEKGKLEKVFFSERKSFISANLDDILDMYKARKRSLLKVYKYLVLTAGRLRVKVTAERNKFHTPTLQKALNRFYHGGKNQHR